ncbi:hypothetical protein LCGC14_2683790 [marine sediment metagenome]|uniref:Uncharacterized protein n=1 Tax=marine sediment metagenome TaxID=412755 RepID=A0A0F9CC92_9ZZZZ
MNYTTVFSQRKTYLSNKDRTKENFVRVSVYTPEDYRFPGLINKEHGSDLNEDWEVSESEWHPTSSTRETAIREGIQMLDAYELGKPCKED